MKRLATILGLWACATMICAQQDDEQRVLADMLEEMAADGTISDDDAEDATALLYDLDPIDLNTATRDELSTLFFLSPSQIESILRYRSEAKGFVVPQEVYLVPGFSSTDATRLLAFSTMGEYESASRRGLRWKNEVTSRLQRTFPKAKGYKAQTDSTEANYAGDPYRLYIRFAGSLGKQLDYGLILENDAGEPMFNSTTTLTDFVAGHVTYKPSKSLVRKIILGHYSAQYGQGLGMWTGFASDGSAMQSSVDRRAKGLRGTLSASESGYMRGAAVSLGTKDIFADVYVSTVDVDATMYYNDDSTRYFTTVKTDGYHRTKSEINSRKNLTVSTIGTYLTLSRRLIKASAGFNGWHSSTPLASDGQAYRHFVPNTRNIGTVHADYHFYGSSFVAYGEVVWQTSNTFAGMQAIDINLGGGNSASFAFRKFGKRYNTMHQGPFSIASNPAGEAGGFASITLAPLKGIGLMADVNFYRNAWVQYQKPFMTNGVKVRAQATYSISRSSMLKFRVRYEDRENSSSENSHQLADRKRLSLRLQWITTPVNLLTLKTAVERVGYGEGSTTDSRGFFVSQEVTVKCPQPNLAATFIFSHFDTDDYNSRIYSYMPDVLYSMSIPTFYGRGVGCLTNIRWRITDFAKLWLWGNYTKYYDRDVISSGNSQLDSSHRFDVKLQLQIRLSHIFRRRTA